MLALFKAIESSVPRCDNSNLTGNASIALNRDSTASNNYCSRYSRNDNRCSQYNSR